MRTRPHTWLLRTLLALAALQVVACSARTSPDDPAGLHGRAGITQRDCMPVAESVVPLGNYTEQASAGVLFIFNDGVSPSDRAHVIAGVEAVRSYLADQKKTPSELVCVDVRVTESGLAGSANATGTHVVIYTTLEGWTTPLSWHLQMVAAHEYVHTWQYQLSGNAPPAGPTWLIEGAAQLIAVRSVISAGMLSGDEAQSMMTRPSGALVPALQDLEDPQSFNIVNAPYDLVCAAADLLTAESGTAGLKRYWMDVGRGTAWQDAFERTFGVTPATFYERFEHSPIRGLGVRPH